MPARVRRLIDNFLGDHGVTPREVRAAVYARAHAFGSGLTEQPPVSEDLTRWVDIIACNPPAASDADIAALKAAGYSEDDIIEVTEAAALGASMARLEIAYRVTGDD